MATALPVVGGVDGAYSFAIATPVADSAGPAVEADNASQTQRFQSSDVQPPQLTVQKSDPAAATGDLFLAPYHGPGQDGPMITDASGNLIWFDPLPNGLETFDFRTQSYKGQPVLTWWQGYVASSGHGLGEDVIKNASYQKIATVEAGNGYHADLHEFELTPSGTALITAYQPVRWDSTKLSGGDVVLDSIVQEIDIATGNVLFEWHSLDNVPVSDSYAAATSPDDYFHVNSIDEDADGNLLVSSRATHAIYQIDRASGDILWRLGGKESDFTGAATSINSQHDAKWLTPTSISIFDNGAGVGDAKEPQTRALIVNLDVQNHTASIAKQIVSPIAQSTSQGDVQPLSNGDIFVGWGSQPDTSEFDSNGNLVFQAALPAGEMNYRAYRLDWQGTPTSLPSAATAVAGDALTVYASWNGATDVASWRILGGASPGALSVATVAPLSGFETAVITGLYAYIAVQALDASGAVLATSATVGVNR